MIEITQYIAAHWVAWLFAAISGALAAMLDLGKGSGPMDHGFAIETVYTKEAEV